MRETETLENSAVLENKVKSSHLLGKILPIASLMVMLVGFGGFVKNDRKNSNYRRNLISTAKAYMDEADGVEGNFSAKDFADFVERTGASINYGAPLENKYSIWGFFTNTQIENAIHSYELERMREGRELLQ